MKFLKRFKLKQKTKVSLRMLFAEFMVMIAFVSIWVGTKLYYVGFHNVDLAFNAINTGVFNLTTLDTNNDFVNRTLGEGYIIGHNQQQLSMFLFTLAGMALMSGILSYTHIIEKLLGGKE